MSNSAWPWILAAGAFSGLVACAWALWRLQRRLRALTREMGTLREAEAALKAGEQRLRATLGAISDAVIAVDLGGRVLHLNAAAERLTGWGGSEALGQPVGQVYAGGGASNATSPVEKVIATGRPAEWSAPFLLSRRDGTERLVSDGAAPLHDTAGAVRGVVLVVRDLSEKRELEDRLARAQRLEELGRLSGGLAHDFNNLLHVIINNLALATDPSGPEEDRKDCLAQIDLAAQRGAELARQLLAFSRQQPMKPAPLDLRPVVEGMARMIRRIIDGGIEVQVQCPPRLPAVLADRGQIEQVIMNLCVNARDAMPAGGSLTLSLAAHEVDEALAARLPGARPGSFVVLGVVDTGKGMDEATLKRIFEPFFTTKEPGHGTGLGLSVVHGIVRQHQGSIDVSSTPGQGTAVRVFLPAGREDPARTAPREAQGPVAKGSGVVLVAEDDRLVREAASAVLQLCGYEVDECANGREAVERAARDPARYAAALLDVVMPVMGGVEAARRLREIRPDLPILFYTGYPGQHLPEKGLGHYATLTKPFTPSTLQSALRDAIRGMQPGH